MATTRLDVVIFGATGFTGKRAVQEMCALAKKYEVTWGVAGRSQSKLEDLLVAVGKKTGEDLKLIRIIIAEVNDEESLKAMCRQARVLVNCCGPYRLYGEPVVKAAIDSKSHYVDVSGEPQFIELMQLKYDALAREAGVLVVSACGLDSVPNDMGVVFLQQNFEGTLNSVESYLSAELPKEYRSAARSGVIHYGTWESLVYSLAHWGELRALRSKLYPNKLPMFKPKLKSRSVIHSDGGGWCLPFPGADGSIVYRSQRYFYENEHQRPVQFKPYIKFPSLFYAVLTVIGAAFLYLMCLTPLTRSLLLKYPRIFSAGLVSHEGPKEEVMDNTGFATELRAQGWHRGQDPQSTPPTNTLNATVSGKNPGYGATAVMLLLCAISILKDADKIPNEGGVVTTGVAFKRTALVSRLNDNGVKFQIVQ